MLVISGMDTDYQLETLGDTCLKMESDAFHEFTNMIFAGTFHLMQLT